ncbi:MAG: hypothetical protein AB8G23_09770 [Myxococcota bacterium]
MTQEIRLEIESRPSKLAETRLNVPRALSMPCGSSFRDWVGALCAIGWLVGMALSVPCEASAQMLDASESEELVRQVYYEGMPEDAAERIGPEGAARLMEMLEDPAEAKHHAQILLALGLCGEDGALEAIRDWAATPREGAVDRATFKAWQALPFALGHLAERDARALDDLEDAMTEDGPAWHFRHHRGARLHGMARKAAATSMAETGLPAARRVLERAERRSSDAEFEAHLRGARALHQRRAQEVGR